MSIHVQRARRPFKFQICGFCSQEIRRNIQYCGTHLNPGKLNSLNVVVRVIIPQDTLVYVSLLLLTATSTHNHSTTLLLVVWLIGEIFNWGAKNLFFPGGVTVSIFFYIHKIDFEQQHQWKCNFTVPPVRLVVQQPQQQQQ